MYPQQAIAAHPALRHDGLGLTRLGGSFHAGLGWRSALTFCDEGRKTPFDDATVTGSRRGSRLPRETYMLYVLDVPPVLRPRVHFSIAYLPVDNLYTLGA